MRSSTCRLTIDLSKIHANYRFLQQFCYPTEVASVVKANAYGLGADYITPILYQAGCHNFFVANCSEGGKLRQLLPYSNVNIFILHGVFQDDIQACIEYHLTPIINHLAQFELWRKFATEQQKILKYGIHIDTGMNRLGFNAKELKSWLQKSKSSCNLKLCHVMSHLATSDNTDNNYNIRQLIKFHADLESITDSCSVSLANSSAVFLGREYYFDLIRLGAALYGINPQSSNRTNPMQSTVKLIAPIIQIQEIDKAKSIGYNLSFITTRKTKIATLPLGYADGYLRHLSNRGYVHIKGYKAPVVGRVSMDLINIDVSDIPQDLVFLGQDVDIIGEYNTLDDIASAAGTIGYEILTNLGSRYNKVYISCKQNTLEFNKAKDEMQNKIAYS